MKTRAASSSIIWLSLVLACLVAVAAWAGLFWQRTYARETPLWAAEGRGGDAVNLMVTLPTLLVNALLTYRGLLSARLVWMGTLLYLLYNFLIYAVAVHFNTLFLVYCGIVSLSFYAFLWSLAALTPAEIAGCGESRTRVKAMATVFFLFAVGFAAQWLGEIIPALVSGGEPSSVREAGLLTSPVHVLDLALMIPAFVLTGAMLLRRRPIAFVLAPVLMVYLILMIVAVSGMLVSMSRERMARAEVLAVFFVASAVGCTLLLLRYFRGLRTDFP